MLRPFLMGSETEYAVSGRVGGKIMPPEVLADWLAGAVRHECRWLQDIESHSGVFLENGGRLYTDINGHPEYATPECSTPREIAAYDKAGERLLLRVAQRMAAGRHAQLAVTKNNIAALAPDSVTWGNHESYLAWIPLTQAAEYLVPHLVTRLPYAGAGRLSTHAEGAGFELSQRARHLVRVVGAETTHDRAIFCTRVRKNSDRSGEGWTRAHLISKDSQRAPLGVYLTFGVTGLLFWMLNQGFVPREPVKLANPVAALHAVSLDPHLRRPLTLADGRQLTPIEIQRRYLADCEAFATSHELPPWGLEVLMHWRAVLSVLSEDPLRLAGKLDAYTKLAMYEHQLQRAGHTWAQVQQALVLQARLRQACPEGMLQALVMQDPGALAAEHRPLYSAALAMVQANGDGALDHLRFALRLQVLDLRYHELGGLYDELHDAGHADAVILDAAAIENALTTPPAGHRAARRGELVRLHHGDSHWAAGWQTVVNRTSREGFDLSNPFDSKGLPITLPT